MRTALQTRIKLLGICCFLSIGGFLLGYNLSLMTGLLLSDEFWRNFQVNNRDYAADLHVLLITAMMAGAFFGAMVSGPLADFIGRRGVVITSTLILTLGVLLVTAADAMSKIYAGRVITGISVGMSSTVIPMYLTEISPTIMRGRLVTIQQFAIVFGISVAMWLCYAGTFIPNEAAWRLPSGLQLIPMIIYIIGSLFIPESPRYLIQKNMKEQALYSLASIRGDGTLEHPDVLMEFAAICQTISFEQRHVSTNYRALFTNGRDKNLRRLFLGMGVQAFQQLTGANTFLLYAPVVLKAANLERNISTLLANAIVDCVVIAGTLPAFFFIDTWNRRTTMIVGALLIGTCSILLAIFGGINDFRVENAKLTSGVHFTSSKEVDDVLQPTNRGTSIAFTVFTFILVFTYGCTWGPIGWIYPVELFSHGLRSKGQSFSTMSNWLFTFGVVQLSPLALKRIAWKVYIIYAVFNAAIAFLVYMLFPETTSRSLEELDLLFSGNYKKYDPKVHHSKTAAEALRQLETRQQQSHHDVLFGQVASAASSRVRSPV